LELPQDQRGREGALVTDQSATPAMWAILKTHDIMEPYIIHNFEDHSSIAAENVRFLPYNLIGAGQSDANSDIKNLEKQVDNMDSSKKLMQSMVDKLAALLDKLKKRRKGRQSAVWRGRVSSAGCLEAPLSEDR
jgi:hypothetical protein